MAAPRMALSLLIVILFAAVAIGQDQTPGPTDPIQGTLTRLSSHSLTVRDGENRTITIVLDKNTVFLKSGRPSSAKQVSVGAKVLVLATQAGTTLTANEVRFGTRTLVERHP